MCDIKQRASKRFVAISGNKGNQKSGGDAERGKNLKVRLGENNSSETLGTIKQGECVKCKRKNVSGPVRVRNQLLRQAAH